jgi:hypothetical protein
MPGDCASIGDSPGPTDHLYNAGSGSHLEAPMEQSRSAPLNGQDVSVTEDAWAPLADRFVKGH